jgi:hypothetical protein
MREYATRAMIFERAANETNTVGQQGRRDCVAGEALYPSAVELQPNGLGPVDAPLRRESKWLVHVD